MANYYQIY